MQWSAWTPIKNRCNRNSAAVYKIALSEREDSPKPIPMKRFTGTDGEGCLSIGETTDMETRRKQFMGGSHSEGILLNIVKKYCRSYQKQFGNAITIYSYAVVESEDVALKEERELIKKYIMDFGEAPPLNSAVPDRYNYDEWGELFNA
ncbi:MAG: hypothetical protein ABSG99_02120 [Sedimentisphaerales bacterium]